MENVDQNVIILFRVLLAVALSFIPGIERELTGKFAGLRTHILVCLGACVFTILSIYGFEMRMSPDIIGTNDPARIAAQIITGIGFIGAGTVMRHGSSVFGITTAATLWVCAAIGMCCGCGQYLTAIITSIVTLVVLILIRSLEKNVLSKRKKSYTLYEISITASLRDCDTIQSIFECNFHKVFKFNKKLVNHEELRFAAVISTKRTLTELNDIFRKIIGIESIEIREYYE